MISSALFKQAGFAILFIASAFLINMMITRCLNNHPMYGFAAFVILLSLEPHITRKADKYIPDTYTRRFTLVIFFALCIVIPFFGLWALTVEFVNSRFDVSHYNNVVGLVVAAALAGSILALKYFLQKTSKAILTD